MAQIVISESMHAGAVAALRARHQVIYDPALGDDEARLTQFARDCDALIVGCRTQVRGSLLRSMRRCKAIGFLGAVGNNVDWEACARRRIEVFCEPLSSARGTAEYVLAASVMLLQGVPFYERDEMRASSLGHRSEAAGKRMGVIGMGPVGRAVGYLAHRVGMTVLAFDPAMDPAFPEFPVGGVEFMSFERVLGASDIVTLHLPDTHRLKYPFQAASMGLMRPGSILIDTSGNRTIDLSALAAALRSGALGGAALDDADGALAPVPQLLSCPNLIVSPRRDEEAVAVSEHVARELAHKLQEILM
jgi:(S)-sulfolactate dehydrogenase